MDLIDLGLSFFQRINHPVQKTDLHFALPEASKLQNHQVYQESVQPSHHKFVVTVGQRQSTSIWMLTVSCLSAGFLVFVNLYCVKYGAIALQEIFDDIQPK